MGIGDWTQSPIPKTSIDVSNFDTSKVTDISQMLESCKTSNVKTIGSMFVNCISLVSLDITMFDISRASSLSSLFYNCTSLKSLDVAKLKTSKITMISNIFAHCSNFTYLDVSNHPRLQHQGVSALGAVQRGIHPGQPLRHAGQP